MKAIAKELFGQPVLSVYPFTTLNYQRDYSASSLIMMFFTFSGLGWVWEVLIHILKDDMLINRGFLTGPWLPIYGFGGILILPLFRKWRSRPLASLGLIILLCGLMEYATSYALESLFGVKWWDYSDMLFQIQGRVCLEGLMIFGIGGLVIIYVAAPLLDNCFQKITSRTRTALCSILLTIFVIDYIHAFIAPNMGFGITF